MPVASSKVSAIGIDTFRTPLMIAETVVSATFARLAISF
jgi:hypothetical protein